VTIAAPLPESLIEGVFFELEQRAAQDRDGCFGYFPAMRGVPGIDHDLPASQKMSEALPIVEIDGRPLHFNFVRLSLVRQHGPPSFHLDTDASTALTGSTTMMRSRLVTRLLLNLSSAYPRSLSFLNVDPEEVPLSVDGGYLYSKEEFSDDSVETIVIPPREQSALRGILFASNRVLHSGRDDERGHFVMAFGREDTA
jgi:hypothetical protein